MIIQLCGLSGAGKSTLAFRTRTLLTNVQVPVEVIDGDLYRSHLCKDLGFSRVDRQENIRRLGFVASRFSRQGIVSIISAINPYEATRQELIAIYPTVKTIFLDCGMDELVRRDTKGLYKRAMLPKDNPDKINNLSGVNDTFETPLKPDLHLHTNRETIEECAHKIYGFIIKEINTYCLHPGASQTKNFKYYAYEQ